jgi:hypothetical protein
MVIGFIDAFLHAEIQIDLLMVEDAVGSERKLVVGISPEGFGTIAMIVNFVVACMLKFS